PSVVWTMPIAESGEIKSPPWYAAVRPLHRRQKIAMAEHRTALEEWMDKVSQWERNSKDPKKKDTNLGPRPEKPILEHLLVSDCTIESIAGILEDNPDGTFLCRDELSAWLSSFSRYKGKSGGTDLPHWCEIFHARPLKVDRKTGDRKTIYVPRAA